MRPLLLAVTTALLLVGCSAAPDGATSEPAAGGAADQGTDVGEAGSDGLGAGDLAVDDASVEDRDMVVEGSVTVTVEDPRGAAQSAVLLVERVGGRVAERSEQAASERDDASARLVLRVPAGEVTTFLGKLEELGTVGSVDTSSTDVTMQTRDLDARIRAMEISVGRLEDFMARTTTTKDLLDAERTLTERQAELEALVSQRTRLADRVEMSTLTVHFWTAADTPVEAGGGFVGGFQTGWESLVTALGTTLLIVGVLLPWLIFAGVVTLAVTALRGRVRRRTPVPPPTPAEPAPQAAAPER